MEPDGGADEDLDIGGGGASVVQADWLEGRRNQRFKGCTDKNKKKRQHKCPICLEVGHHWHTCKKGNPEDKKALAALREPKKKKKAASQSSIVPMDDETTTQSMSFPPSLSVEPETKKKGKRSASESTGSAGSQSIEPAAKKKSKQGTTESTGSARSKKGSNQPEPSTELTSGAAPTSKTVKAKAKTKTKWKNIAKDIAIKPLILDSPAMGTRSKICNPVSPAMSTRSKMRLSL